MERFNGSVFSSLYQDGTFFQFPSRRINPGTAGIQPAVAYNSKIKQYNTLIKWTLKGVSSTVDNLVFRVTIVMSKAYFCWLPQNQPGYIFGTNAPPTQFLFNDYIPSSQVRTEVLPFVDILYDKCYNVTKSTGNVVFDELFIPEFTYTWPNDNQITPTYNGLWFLITAVDCSNWNSFTRWGGGQNSAPSYDLSWSGFLEHSEN